ncbi:hypothetical protein CL617_01550 [archaeon]|nr:hypothetical protein [archaeon]|tara:strand:- start:8438 stop:8893 length:456 start_codon:yes stop_codon:yes gene_type:complete
MHNLKQLSNKEKKLLIKKIELQYGISSLKIDFLFFKNNDNKIYVINKEFRELNSEKLNISVLGMYFAKFDRELRLTTEGCQLLGKFVKKNILELNEEQSNEWLQGHDLEGLNFKDVDETFIILKNNEDYIGCGKHTKNKILNYVPKERRIK